MSKKVIKIKNSVKDRVAAELELLRKQNKLDAKSIVEFARTHKKSALHRQFDWNIKRAAEQHWLDRARAILKVYVVIIEAVPPTGPTSVRVKTAVPRYIAITTKRGQENNYKLTMEVMHDKRDRGQLLIDTIERLQQVKEVALFPELREVARAIAVAADKFIRRKAAAA